MRADVALRGGGDDRPRSNSRRPQPARRDGFVEAAARHGASRPVEQAVPRDAARLLRGRRSEQPSRRRMAAPRRLRRRAGRAAADAAPAPSTAPAPRRVGGARRRLRRRRPKETPASGDRETTPRHGRAVYAASRDTASHVQLPAAGRYKARRSLRASVAASAGGVSVRALPVRREGSMSEDISLFQQALAERLTMDRCKSLSHCSSRRRT